jgi:hypothetical protein
VNLKRLPSGTWRVSVKYRGERRTGTAPSEGDARMLGAQMLLDLGGGGRLAELNFSPTSNKKAPTP